ncbi:CD9 antigen [Dissostichus eleginoides]|uniref:CD9 antigen n=1 Tax=Dissostichus eleginoides TaxID=100907 RepID=A0AAD9B5D9_DISEL|nr:CD9 antigen [Dissostichus eleginoides]
MALDECGLIFALVGFVFLGLGLKLRFSDSTRAIFEFETLNSSEFDMVVTVLIIMGSVMLIVVVFGDNGPLLTFSALVTILAGALIVFGVIANSRKDEIGLRIAEFYSSIYLQYLANGDPALADTLTFIQELT